MIDIETDYLDYFEIVTTFENFYSDASNFHQLCHETRKI
jgi:hypothetical protein